MIKRDISHANITLNLPDQTYEKIEDRNKETIDSIINQLQEQYQPLPAITGLKIAI